jgi:hypothetical protein
MCREKSICRDTEGTCRKSWMVEGSGFVFKDADDGKTAGIPNN